MCEGGLEVGVFGKGAFLGRVLFFVVRGFLLGLGYRF